jgi:phosphoribosylaminoimidazole-succinocarboxamide synthase
MSELVTATGSAGSLGACAYEGKAKIVRPARDGAPDRVEIFFKDDATAFNGKKKAELPGKGRFNARISSRIFRYLERHGVRTHFLDDLDDRTLLARRLSIVPIEVVVRNVAAGSLVRRLAFPEGRPLSPAIVELYLKDDRLGDPLILPEHALALGIADAPTLGALPVAARRANELLCELAARMDLTLVDFKLEFGRHGGELLLGDEISPDTCRFWDRATGRKLDKDRFRLDLGDVMGAYREVLRRVEAALP